MIPLNWDEVVAEKTLRLLLTRATLFPSTAITPAEDLVIVVSDLISSELLTPVAPVIFNLRV